MNNDLHRCFIQYMIQNSYVDIEKVISFCQRFAGADFNKNDLEQLATEVNSNIKLHDLSIEIGKSEISGIKHVVLVNSHNSNWKHCSPWEKREKNDTQFFFQVTKELIEVSEDNAISVMSYLNITNGLSLTKDRAEELLQKWISLGYLTLYDDKITFGLRFIYEFSPILSTKWSNFVKKCNLCTDVVFVGKSCATCDMKMHFHCLNKFLRNTNNCPNCKNNLNLNEHSQENNHFEEVESN